MRTSLNLPAALMASAVCSTFSLEKGWPAFCTNTDEKSFSLTVGWPAVSIGGTFCPSVQVYVCLADGGVRGMSSDDGVCAMVCATIIRQSAACQKSGLAKECFGLKVRGCWKFAGNTGWTSSPDQMPG